MHYSAVYGYESKVVPGQMFRDHKDVVEHDLERTLEVLSFRGAPERGSPEYRAMKFLVEYIDSLQREADAEKAA